MQTSHFVEGLQKYNKWAIASFVLGVAALIFPAISAVFLITANGGPGYLQSLFLGVPVAVMSIMAGVAVLVQRKKSHPGSYWMAAAGTVFGSMFFVISMVMVLVLLWPYLMSIVQ